MKSYARAICLFVAFFTACLLLTPNLSLAQSLTLGDIIGTVTDPSGAAVSNATVTLKNNDIGVTQNVTANGTGGYRFPMLNPGSYTLSASAVGFQGRSQNVLGGRWADEHCETRPAGCGR